MTAEMGKTYDRAAAPSGARTYRTSSVAYATEEIASEERTASAVVLVSRSVSSRSVARGRPTIRRLARSSGLAIDGAKDGDQVVRAAPSAGVPGPAGWPVRQIEGVRLGAGVPEKT